MLFVEYEKIKHYAAGVDHTITTSDGLVNIQWKRNDCPIQG